MRFEDDCSSVTGLIVSILMTYNCTNIRSVSVISSIVDFYPAVYETTDLKHQMDPCIVTSLNKICELMRVSNQLHTFPSPNLALTLNCYQLTAVGLGEG